MSRTGSLRSCGSPRLLRPGVEPLRRLSKRNRLAISHVSRYYLEMLRFRLGRTKEQEQSETSTECGLKKPRAFSTILTDAYFTIPSIPSARIGSFYWV